MCVNVSINKAISSLGILNSRDIRSRDIHSKDILLSNSMVRSYYME